jgi:hypothetical protein
MIEIEDRRDEDEEEFNPKIDAKFLLRADAHLSEALTALWHAYHNLHFCILRAGDVLVGSPESIDSARYFLIPAEAALEYALVNFRAAYTAYSIHSGSSTCGIMMGISELMHVQIAQAELELRENKK